MNFLRMRTRSALRKNKSIRQSIPYQQAKSIGILFSVEDKDKHASIKEFMHRLEQDGKQVKVLEYLPAKAENYEFMFDFFTAKQLNFWGELKSDVVRAFINTPFDFLFYIDRETNPLALYLLASSQARCRVGRYHETESGFFELMIEQNGTNRGLIDTMYKYTQQLR